MSETLKVAVSDFPYFNGLTSADDFLAQCKRLGDLGSLSPNSLGKVTAARCTGEALKFVNELECSGVEITFASVSEALQKQFSTKPTADQAAVLLSRLKKGSLSAQEYGRKVKTLVRNACAEFFASDGQLKKICVPAYEAALYRHFLVGLSPDETALLSRMKVTTFENAITELVREETLADLVDEGSRHSSFANASVSREDRPAVRWASPLRQDRPGAPNRAWRERGHSPRERSSDDHASGRRSMDDGRDPGGWTTDVGRDASPHCCSGRPELERRGRGRSPAGRSPRRRYQRGPGGASGGRSPSPGAPRGGDFGGGRPGSRRAGSGRGSVNAEDRHGDGVDPDPEGEPYRPGPPAGRAGVPRCWSCRGWGHLKRHCPNGEVADRW